MLEYYSTQYFHICQLGWSIIPPNVSGFVSGVGVLFHPIFPHLSLGVEYYSTQYFLICWGEVLIHLIFPHLSVGLEYYSTHFFHICQWGLSIIPSNVSTFVSGVGELFHPNNSTFVSGTGVLFHPMFPHLSVGLEY